MKKIRLTLLLILVLSFLAACHNIETTQYPTQNYEEIGTINVEIATKENFTLSYGAVVGLEDYDGTIQKAVVIGFSEPEEEQQCIYFTLYPGYIGRTVFSEAENIGYVYSCVPEQIVKVYYTGKDDSQDSVYKLTNQLPVGSIVKSEYLDENAGIENGFYIIVSRNFFVEEYNLCLFDYIVKEYPYDPTDKMYPINNCNIDSIEYRAYVDEEEYAYEETYENALLKSIPEKYYPMGTFIERNDDNRFFMIIANQVEFEGTPYDYVSINIRNINDFHFFNHDNIYDYKLIDAGYSGKDEPLTYINSDDIKLGAVVTLKNGIDVVENTKYVVVFKGLLDVDSTEYELVLVSWEEGVQLEHNPGDDLYFDNPVVANYSDIDQVYYWGYTYDNVLKTQETLQYNMNLYESP